MAVSTCWMVIDLKDTPLGVGFTKKQARFNARDYLLNVSTTVLTPNQAMNELKRRLHHKYLFFRKYELCEIEFGPDGRSSYHPNNRSLKSEVMKLRKENLHLKGWKSILQELLESQEKHYGEMAVLASAGSRLHSGEADMTEGVIKGIEYCIEALAANKNE